MFTQRHKGAKFCFILNALKRMPLLKPYALAPIEVEILLLFSLKSKRLKQIAGDSSIIDTEIQK